MAQQAIEGTFHQPLARMAAALLSFVVCAAALAAPPATMSFQGYLTGSGGAPVTGNQAIVFRLYDVAAGGAALWTETQPSVAVSAGIYNVTLGALTPMALPFDAPYFLGITVGAESEMTPRLPLASVGYAFRAREADTVAATAIADASLTAAKFASSGCGNGQVLQYNGSAWVCATISGGGGSVTSVGTGSGLTGGPITTTGTINLAATQLLPTVACSPGQVPRWSGSAWTCAAGSSTTLVQGGNAFGAAATIGTTDNQAVSIVANNIVGLRIAPNATGPVIVGGHSGNTVAAGVAAAVVGGGGTSGTSDPITFSSCGLTCANLVTDHGGTIGGGVGNQAGDDAGTSSDRAYATVGGGLRNFATGRAATISGGLGNTASGNGSIVSGGSGNFASGGNSHVGGGDSNTASGSGTTVGSGFLNQASGAYAVVGGGFINQATGSRAMVPGGVQNRASGASSFAAGTRAKTETGGSPHNGAFVWADSNDFDFLSTAHDEFSVRAVGGVRFVTAIDGSGSPAAQVTIDNTATLTPNNISLPAVSTSTAGAIRKGADRFLHNFGTLNTFLGVNAGNYTMTGIGQVGVGAGALGASSSGDANTAVGFNALQANTSGANNTAVGSTALAANTSGANNTGLGAGALAQIAGANNSNTGVGGSALLFLTAGSFNTAVGYNAGNGLATGSSNIYVGASAGSAAESSTTRIGGSQSRAFIAGVRGATTGTADAIAVMVDSAGQLGTVSSSVLVKDAVADMGDATAALMKLRPVTFRYAEYGPDSRLQYGLIAEEVDQVYPGLVAKRKDGSAETVMYHFLPPMLLNELQKQQRKIEKQAGEIAELRKMITELAARR